MWTDAARMSSLQARGGQGAAQSGALQAGLAAAGATSRGKWGRKSKQPPQRVIITGAKAPPTGGSVGGAAHQAGVSGIQPNMGASGNVAANAYASGPPY